MDEKLFHEKIENSFRTKDKKKQPKLEKGVDTMFRTTLSNHNNLSRYVDNKAHILLSVNAIIVSISLSKIFPKLDNHTNAHLFIPTLILIVFSVTSMIFAILATKPSITKGSFTRKEVEEKKVNLLFFGNFYKMPYQDYNWAMNELLKDSEYIYNSMIKDLYHLGIVLEKKYRLLRTTYNIFMCGIIISVIAFLIAFKFR
ncbi:MAG TPA: Pycsar system effector family protein [Flavobacterium sp.]|uniref:Pycsar system effector family protein n=1 Tax=Flavobacterium sp. TaxID=239 RepID=UPI002DBB7F0D|nr:Pycsar system effector family protein [Flavobacterium sp.]HEU4791999.1 Pycsar system effector family protein [Flavobacterium sp.]